MTVFEMAKKYYSQNLWDKQRIRWLCEYEKITEEQYKEITGEEF